ncbi:unnamed protein product, partial [Mesorhabditis belari]|uniref:Bax inhibitor 1 n=1 Tax=Mesorhabditis belari TaxID=2138241 RepID=A0AAF3J5F7_9BILA
MARTAHDATSFFKNIDRTFTALDDKLEKSVKEHLRNVYGTLAMGLGAAAFGAAVHLFTDILRANFLLTLGSIGLMFMLISTPATLENQMKRFGYFFGFCFISGVSTGPLLEQVIRINPSIIFTALMATVFVFGAFTLAALHAPSTKYLYLGGTLASASLGLLCLALFSNFYNVILWGGLAVSCGFILYDTQLIVEKNRRGDQDFIWHAVELFIDFAQVFRYLLVLLSQKEKRDERRRRD